MITFVQKGDYSKTDRFLHKLLNKKGSLVDFDKYGQLGVEALASHTPKKTGKTAASWKYEIEKNANGVSIVWSNDNINDNVSIAIILQYGHGTRSGAYVQGIDYINPAIAPIFKQLSNDAWNEVTNK